MRKYVKPRAKFHELKAGKLLAGSDPKIETKGVSTHEYEYVEDYGLNDSNFTK